MCGNAVPTIHSDAGKIGVYCSHVALEPVETLKRHPSNPNTHPDAQLEHLARIIKEQGWRAPIVVSRRSGYIVKGHGRYESALILGCEKVPIDYQDYDSDASEVADMIADNRIAELSHLYLPTVRSLVDSIDTDFNVELTGFTIDEIAAIDVDLEPLQEPVDPPEAKVKECPACGHEWR